MALEAANYPGCQWALAREGLLSFLKLAAMAAL